MIPSLTGVNQAASGILFRKYLQDLDEYLKKDAGVCIGETLVAHLLWVDHVVLFSNTKKIIQKQINGLKHFCTNDKMIVNEATTKLMIFGIKCTGHIILMKKKIELANEYKYLGKIIRST